MNLQRAFPLLLVFAALFSPLLFAQDEEVKVTPLFIDEKGNPRLTWSTKNENYGYTVERNDDGLRSDNWLPAQGDWPILDTEADLLRLDPTIPLSELPLQSFFRVRAALLNPPYLPASDLDDEDEDGLSDYHEAELGTDPLNSDTDGDGLIDGYEYFLTQHPSFKELNLSLTELDSDGDFVDDLSAVVAAMAGVPFSPDGAIDSDGDTLPDNLETLLGTDPTKMDTDGDGVDDNVEDAQGTSPHHAADEGSIDYFLPFSDEFEFNYRTDPNLIGSSFDALTEAFGYVEPTPSALSNDIIRPTAGTSPIGTGNEERPIYIVYVIELQNGQRAGRVPTSLCGSGYLLLKPEILRQEEVTLADGTKRMMTTIKPFSEFTQQEIQNCCVQGTIIDNADSIIGQFVELFGDELSVLRTTVNYILTHGLLVFDLEDAARLYQTRDKFIRCCGMGKVEASALSLAIMVAVNRDSISLEFLLGMIPFKIGDVISAADRALFNQFFSNAVGDIIPDEEGTQFLCEFFLWYLCRKYMAENETFGCPNFAEIEFARAVSADRAERGSEAGGGDPDDGNQYNDNVGRSVPVDYMRGQPDTENPEGNKPPPGGAKGVSNGEKAGNNEAANGKGDGNDGDGNNNGGNNGGGNNGPSGKKDDGPKGGTPGGPYLVPGIPDDEIPGIWNREFGDAPDEDIPAGYPSPNYGIIGKFPTTANTENSRYDFPGGHISYPGYVWLGRRYSMEIDAISGDQDFETNLDILKQFSNRDYFDDGLIVPTSTNPCGMTGFIVAINSWEAAPIDKVYINVLIDFNRDGEWKDKTEGAAEWAVQNFEVELIRGTEQIIALPPFQTPCEPFPAWTRIMVSDLPFDPEIFSDGGWDGSGGVNFGEVEDYFVE